MAQNVEINIKNESGEYEVIYPKTKAENVIDLPESGITQIEADERYERKIETKIDFSSYSMKEITSNYPRLDISTIYVVSTLPNNIYSAYTGKIEWKHPLKNGEIIIPPSTNKKNTILTGVAIPEELNDATNKKYVDDLVGNISTILDTINGEVV